MNKACHKLTLIFALVVITALSVYLFAASMSKAMSSDENMYCTGGFLLNKGLMIYRDFPYATQLPYHPLLCAAVYKLTGTTHYLLAGRFVSVVCDVLIVICIFSIVRKIFAQYFYSGILLGLMACMLFVFNPFVGYLLGLAWNHDMVLLCIVLSFRIFLEINTSGNLTPSIKLGANGRVFVIAAMLTIAVWTRATSVFFMPVFFAMIAYSAWAKAHPTSVILSFLYAVIIFSIVPLYIVIQSGRAFFVNVFLISSLHGQLLHNLHIAYDKSYLTIMAFRNNAFLFLILTAVFIWLVVFAKARLLRRIENETPRTDIAKNTLLAILLLITSIIITYFPPTMWKQYFGIPVVFVIILCAFALSYLRTIGCYKICVTVFVALSLTTMISQKPVSKISKCLSPTNWTPIKVHNISKQIVATARNSKTILTLSPLYSIEGGGQIYTELSAGVSAFRAADKLSAHDRAITHTTGLKELPELVRNNPADAIVIGPELTRFDKIDLKSIVPADWQRIDCGSTSVHNFFPPKGL